LFQIAQLHLMIPLLLNLTTLCALVVPLLYLQTTHSRLNRLFALLLLSSVATSVSWTAYLFNTQEVSSFALAIWISLSSTLLLFGLFSTWQPSLLKLSPLVFGFSLWTALWGTLWTQMPSAPSTASISTGQGLLWHIFFTILSYGFATLAALSAFAAFWVERGLNHKRPTPLRQFLPAVLESEAILFRFLIWTLIALSLGFTSGSLLNYFQAQALIVWDHKTIFSLASLIAILTLLIAHHFTGLRGRLATRLVLLAYLLMNLGFLGVKFATSVVFA